MASYVQHIPMLSRPTATSWVSLMSEVLYHHCSFTSTPLPLPLRRRAFLRRFDSRTVAWALSGSPADGSSNDSPAKIPSLRRTSLRLISILSDASSCIPTTENSSEVWFTYAAFRHWRRLNFTLHVSRRRTTSSSSLPSPLPSEWYTCRKYRYSSAHPLSIYS